jgi:cytoskeletal protein RodZ
MIRISAFCLAAVLSNAVAIAQTAPAPPTTTPPASSQHLQTHAQSQSRPDAVYPHPSGQDSPTNKQSPSAKKPSSTAPQQKPGIGTGTVEQRGTKAANQAAPVRKLAKQKAYTGNSGSKQDPGTVCSTARPTPNGGVDCGTSGDGATLGKIVTKSH